MQTIWWSSNGDFVQAGLLRPLLGHTVVKLEHAALVANVEGGGTDIRFVCRSSLIFTLENGRRWELLDAQSSDMEALIFKEIVTLADIVTAGDLEKEPDEEASTVAVDGPYSTPPWLVDGITEIWTHPGDSPTFRGFILWGVPDQVNHAKRLPLIAIFADTDDLRIRPIQEIWEILRRDHFYVKETLYHFYDVGDGIMVPEP